MIVRSSVKFSGVDIGYTNSIRIEATPEQIQANTQRAVSLSLSAVKKRCEGDWMIDYNTMCSIQVYFWLKGKEIMLFKKEKE